MVLLWAGSGSLALAKEVSLSPDLGGEDTSKLGDFPPPDLKSLCRNDCDKAGGDEHD